jgi:hypothetical protein
MEQARANFNEFTSASKARGGEYPQTNGFIKVDPKNMSKTNPIPK